MKKQTKAIHTAYVHPDAYNALNFPVYQSVSYEFADAQAMSDAFSGVSHEPNYSRTTNPTVTHFEHKVRELANAPHTTAFNSGMAAISNTLFALSAKGKTIVTTRHLFGNTFSLIVQTLGRFGVKVRLCDLTNKEAVEKAMDETVCCIFFEILTNPQLEVANIADLAAIAHSNNVPLVADSTMIPFTEINLGEQGVDIEVVSSTKYISGGATSLGGLVIDYGTTKGFHERMTRELLYNLGAYMTPQVAYLQTLGLETLKARYAVHQQNALQLAQRLQKLEGIEQVNYVGLEDNPYHELAKQQFGPTAGAMLTFDLKDRDACFSFINRLKLIKRSTNLFDNRTLAIHPASTIFASFHEIMKKQMDVRETTIRLSIGLEDVDDLFEDIKQALEG